MTIKKLILYAAIGNLFLFFLGPYTLSQGSKKNIQQQKKEEIPRPAYEVEVIVTNVDVVVTDKAGKRIRLPITAYKINFLIVIFLNFIKIQE